MKHPLTRAALAAAAAAVIAISVIFVTTNRSSATPRDAVGWTGTWSTGLVPPSPGDVGGSKTGFANESVRMIVHLSLGGDHVRLRFSNEFGTNTLTIGRATVGLPANAAGGSANLVPHSLHGLTFNGATTTKVYPGAEAVTDSLDWHVKPNSNLAVTIFFPTKTGPTSWHPASDESTFIYDGDVAEKSDGAGATATRQSFYFLTGVDVRSEDPARSIVVLGDSIANGNGATVNRNVRWPDLLSERINGSDHASRESVLNESLAGNAATHNGDEIGAVGFGTSGLARLNDNVYAQLGVHTVIVELGVNDINFYEDSADRLIAGLKQLAARLREHNLNAVICTIGPFGGFTGPPGWNQSKEDVRSLVNDYIRSQHDFNYVIDMDAVLRDPANPTKLLPAFSFDGIHPNDAGAQTLVNSINLSRL